MSGVVKPVITGSKGQLQEFKCRLFASTRDGYYSELREEQQLVLGTLTIAGRHSWPLAWRWGWQQTITSGLASASLTVAARVVASSKSFVVTIQVS